MSVSSYSPRYAVQIGAATRTAAYRCVSSRLMHQSAGEHLPTTVGRLSDPPLAIPTNELHRDMAARHSGKYARLRESLDEEWHGRYSETRQCLHDGIVDEFVSEGCTSASPWVVLTAGPMGAGKSYTMRWLATAGAFPLERFVVVNPDVIKSRLPEMPGLIQANRALAGSLTHKESGYIAELIERAAAEQRKNILIDGSLRNADWHERMLRRLRERYPHYRVAILLVTAGKEKIYERAERRAGVTGRDIPRAVLDEAISQVPVAYARVAPFADFTAVIINDDDRAPPVFVPPASLESFSELWNQAAVCDLPAS